MSNFESDGLQQQETIPGLNPVSSEWKTADTIHTGSSKLDTIRKTLPVHSLMTTLYPSSDGYLQQDNAPLYKDLMFLEYDDEVHSPPMASTVTRSVCGVGDLHHGGAADKSATAV